MKRKREPSLLGLSAAQMHTVDRFASAALVGLTCGLPASTAAEQADSLTKTSYVLAGAMLRARAAFFVDYTKRHAPD
jgi:hypothetical protein